MIARNKVTFLMGLLLVGMTVSTAGCMLFQSRPAALLPEMVSSNGVIYGSLSVVNGFDTYPWYYMDFKSESTGELVTLIVQAAQTIDSRDGRLNRYIWLKPVAPGTYELTTIRVFTTDGYTERTWTHNVEGHYPVKVEAGKSVYVGAGVVIPRLGENAFGIDVIYGPRFFAYTNLESDHELAKRIYPNLPETVVPDWLPKSMLDEKEVLEDARKINPDHELWSQKK